MKDRANPGRHYGIATVSTISGRVKFEWGTNDGADLRQITLAPWMGTG